MDNFSRVACMLFGSVLGRGASVMVIRCVALALLLLSPGVVAQVVMDLPFIPIGMDGYLPPVGGNAPMAGHFVFRGKDENGADVYATDWVEIPADEWNMGMDSEAGHGDAGRMRDKIEDSGMSVDPFAPPGERIFWGPTDPWWMDDQNDDDWTGSVCRRPAGSGWFPLNSGPVTFPECRQLLAAYWGATFVFETGVWIANHDVNGCFVGFTVHDDAGGGSPGLVRGSWVGVAATDCEEFPEIDPPGLNYEVNYITNNNTNISNMFLMPPSAAAAAAAETGPPIVPPSQPMSLRDVEHIIINNVTYNSTTVFSSVADKAEELTDLYEAAGDLGDLPEGGSSEAPPGVLETGPGESGATTEGLEQFCERNRRALMCQEVAGPSASAMSDAAGDVSDIRGAAGSLRSTLEGLLAEAEAYVLGMGPDLGLSPSGSCPLAGGISVDGLDHVIDTGPLCDVTGGPIRLLMMLLAYVASSIVVLRGVGA